MQIINANELDFDIIAATLKKGGVIIYPTDTAYALGCDATNEEAVAKIFQIKGREMGKTLPLIVADRAMAEAWAEFSSAADKLASQYWPGPLTLVLPVKKAGLALGVVGADGFIALRVPKNDMARGLSAALGAPLVSTSANAAGQGPFFNIESVKESLADSLVMIDYLIDGGELTAGAVSTIVKVCDNKIEVIRQGAIKTK